MAELVHVPSGTRTLSDLIAFNSAHAGLELPPGYEDQHRYYISVHFPLGMLTKGNPAGS
jgi:hypothetical protein